MSKSTTDEGDIMIPKEDASTFSWLETCKEAINAPAADALLKAYAAFGFGADVHIRQRKPLQEQARSSYQQSNTRAKSFHNAKYPSRDRYYGTNIS